MSDGEKKNVKVTRVSSQPPNTFGDPGKEKESWKVETEEAGVIQVVQPKGTPAPKVGENLFVTIYPPKSDKYPPSAYPVKPGGGGGGSFKKSSPEERRSIERQVAAKCATELAVAGKIETSMVAEYTDLIARAIAT